MQLGLKHGLHIINGKVSSVATNNYYYLKKQTLAILINKNRNIDNVEVRKSNDIVYR